MRRAVGGMGCRGERLLFFSFGLWRPVYDGHLFFRAIALLPGAPPLGCTTS